MCRDWSRTAPAFCLSSLAVEEQFYFVWPFVVLFTSEKTLLRISLAALVIVPVLRMVCTPFVPNMFYIYVLTPFRADLLCAGAALALLWKKPDLALHVLIRRWSWRLCLAGFASFAIIQVFPEFRLPRNTPLANGLVYSFSLLGALGLLAWVLADQGKLRQWLSFPLVRYLGEISYTMYLVHVMFITRLEQWLGVRVWTEVLALGVIVAYASLSWFVMEKPLIRFAARTPARLRPAQPIVS